MLFVSSKLIFVLNISLSFSSISSSESIILHIVVKVGNIPLNVKTSIVFSEIAISIGQINMDISGIKFVESPYLMSITQPVTTPWNTIAGLSDPGKVRSFT